jgi:glycosyltransferase involved in cell wall biosynthesis
MKIGFFSTMAGQPWGGSEELWSRAAAVLLNRGHDVTFNTLAWRTTPAPLQKLIDHGAHPFFRTRWRMGRSMRQTLQRLRLTRLKYRSWLQKRRPDFVLISFACHTDDPQIALSCRAAGVSYAILLQAAGSHSWIDPRSLDDFRAAYLGATRCYFVSGENRDVIESNLAMDLPRAEIVDNPFNVRIETAPNWPSTSPYWKLACVARVNYATKGQDLLPRVMRLPKWRQRPLQVSICGSDNGNLKQLQQAIHNDRLGAQVMYRGVSGDIEQLWAEHHGLLLPSRAEGNALSLLEAMICGRVPITTNVGRAGELIDDNETGFIAPAATVELMDEVLERAWQRRADWQAIGQRAARTIRARHSLQPAADFADRILDAAMQSSVDGAGSVARGSAQLPLAV